MVNFAPLKTPCKELSPRSRTLFLQSAGSTIFCTVSAPRRCKTAEGGAMASADRREAPERPALTAWSFLSISRPRQPLV